MNRLFRHRVLPFVLVFGLSIALPSISRADEVLDWNAVTFRAIAAAASPGPVQGRLAAIVHVSIFDALNGIERRFTPIHVDAVAPKGASRRAAVASAAYTALTALFPAQSFAADLEASLAQIGPENSVSIERGRAWGEQVANEILAWRSTDGFNPQVLTYVGSLEVGKWRPTPRPGPGGTELAGLPGAFPTMATTTPFVIPSPSHFRSLEGPPALTSAEYAADVNEVKLVGEDVAPLSARSADQTQSARFWAGTALSFFNRAAVTASLDRHLTLSENARLFALLNVAVADTVISAWDAKYFFEFWRPITAIRLADTDANPATIEDVDWKPLITTPAYPEYDSGHQSNTGAAQAILTAYFGNVPVEGFSEALPGVVRSWPTFAAAADEALLARIWSGIHFRFAMLDTRERAEQIAAYVLEHAAQPLHGQRRGQLPN